MKKLFTLLFAFVAISASASEKIGNLNYNLNTTDNTAEVTSGSLDEYSGAITIPSSVRYNGVTYRVTGISAYAFANNSAITSVTIPSSIASVGEVAFCGCINLESATINSSLISDRMFSNCTKLSSVTIGSNVTSIGSYAFESCYGLFSVTVPKTVTTIDTGAFYGVANVVYAGTAEGSPWDAKCVNGYIDGYLLYTGATKNQLVACNSAATGAIVVPNSVTTINSRAFSNCKGITSITLPSGISTIGSNAFYGCSGLPVEDNIRYADWYLIEVTDKTKSSYSIKDGTKWIAREAFANCTNVVTLNVPNSVNTIESYAFDGIPNVNYTGTATGSPWGAKCVNGYVDGLFIYTDNSKTTLVSCDPSASSTIVIPNSVTTIQSYAFRNCANITNISIPNSVTTIGSNAFYGCTGLPVEDGIRYADWYMAEVVNKTQTSYTIKSGTKWIPENFFRNNSYVTSITIPNSVTSIGVDAFGYCTKLSSITIPSSVTSIGNYAFEYCSGLENATINSSLISDRMFSNCTKLSSVTIGSNVTSIGSYAFSGCSSLFSITVPATVTTISYYAFDGLYNVAYTGSASNSPWGAKCVNGTIDGYLLFNDKSKTTLVGCNPSVKGAVTIPNTVTTVQSEAFYKCTGMTSISIPNSVVNMSTNAFYGCTGLPNIGNLRYADKYLIGAIDRTQSSYTIQANTKWIGQEAFFGCSNLESLSVRSSVIAIGSNAFSNIPNVIYSGTATGSPWGAKCVNGYVEGWLIYTDASKSTIASCNKAATGAIVIPNSVTTINAKAFQNCEGITDITIPNSVTTIGSDAFLGCTSLPVEDGIRYADWYMVAVVNKSQTSYTIKQGTKWIPESFFRNNSYLTSITIPNSVTSIGSGAFEFCTKLSSITIPSSVTSIGSYAFEYCSGLENATINSSSISDRMFSGCSKLSSVTIGSNVTSIGSDAFSGCSSLFSIIVPANVTTIASYAFSGIANVVYSGTAPGSPWDAKCVNGYIDGYLLYTGATKNQLVACNSAATGAIVVPNSVTTINSEAFSNCKGITSITLPSGISTIGSNAFYGCTGLPVEDYIRYADWYLIGVTDKTMSSYSIKNGTKWIAQKAFFDCINVRTLDVPATVTNIGSNAFYNVPNVNYSGTATGSPWGAKCINGYEDGLFIYTDATKTTLVSCDPSASGGVVIPNSVTTIQSYAFRNCKGITSISIPNSVTTIGSNAFYGCTGLPIEDGIRYADWYIAEVVNHDQTSYSIKQGTKWIPNNCFDNEKTWNFNNLTSVTIPNSVTKIGNYAFRGCYNLSTINIPNGVTSIGSGAFYNCKSITSIAIPSSVTTIGSYAFYDCTIFSLTVPTSVTSIGNEAFAGIKNVVYYGSATGSPWGAGCINGYAEGYLLYTDASKTVLVGCEKSATGTIVLPSTLTTIKADAFNNCKGISDITIPNSVTTIGSNAFYGCTSLPVEDGIRYADWYIVAVVNQNQTSYTIRQGTKWIPQRLFSDNSYLTSITLPNSIISIGNYAFENCTKLTSITIPSSVTSIGSYAFENCTGLESATINSSMISSRMFSGCSKLSSVTIGSNVTSIGSYAFSGCSSIFSLNVPNTVTTINSYAFSGIPNVVYSGTATGSPWGAKCINGYMEGFILYTDATKVTVAVCHPSATGSISLPNSVTTIKADAFKNCKSITNITLPTSITSIGSGAFYGCIGLPVVDTIRYADWYLIGALTKTLSSYSIKSGTKWIAPEAFYNCTNIRTLDVPATVTNIGSNAFYDVPNVNYSGTATGSPWGAKCINGYVDGLFIYTDATKTTLVSCDPSASGTIVIPNSVTTIQSYAFRNCTNITNVSIPNSVTTIGSNAFYGCTGLPVDDGIRYADWYIVEIVNHDQTFYTIRQGTKWIPNNCFDNEKTWNFNNLTSVTIPNSVTKIGDCAFRGCYNLSTINIPNRVTTIGSYAFYSCSNIVSITIPNSVTSIGSYAFFGCSKLFNLSVPNSVTSIGNYAFSYITNVNYTGTAKGSPWGAKYINGYVVGDLVFSDITQTSLVACNNAVVGSITIPSTVTTISDYIFRECNNLTAIVVDEANTAYCSVDGVLFNKDTTTLLQYSRGNNATTYVLPNSVTKVNAYAFNNCDALTSVTLSENLSQVGAYAFYNCDNLRTVTSKAVVPPTLGNGSEYHSDYDECFPYGGTLYVPINSLADYQGSRWAKLFSQIIGCCIVTFMDNDGNILDVCTAEYGKAVTRTPSAPQLIGYSFSNWSDDLTNITSDLVVAPIYTRDAFDGLYFTFDTSSNTIALDREGNSYAQMTHIVVPKTLEYRDRTWTVIGVNDNAIAGCMYLQDISFPSSLLTIGQNIFTNCYLLESVTFFGNVPYGLTAALFNQCVNLSTIYVPCNKIGVFRNALSGLNVNFVEISPYTCTAKSSNEEYGTVTMVANYSCPTSTVTLTATASPGYRFDHWDDGNTQNPRTITLTQDVTYTAYFVEDVTPTYTVTANANPSYAGSVNVTYNEDHTQATMTANANSGYRFTYWNDGNTQNPRTIALTQDVAYTAYFVEDATPTITAYASPAYAGSVNVSYNSDHSRATLTANANEGYQFVKWTDGNTTNPRMVNVTRDATYTALFAVDEKPEYTVSTSVYPADAGTVEVVYSADHSMATMTAIGSYGYHFARWKGGNTDNPRTVVLTQDTTFMALFEHDLMQVTYIGMDGQILGVEEVPYGSTAHQVGIDADVFGYTLVGWDKDLNHVTENLTVTAIYKRDAVNGFYYIYDRDARTAVLDHEGNSYANIRKLNVPNNIIYRGIKFAVVAVGANAFENCDRMTDVVLPGNVEDVEEYAFSGCTDLVHLTMSANLRGIADYAFNGCKRLEDITVYAQRVPDLTATSFNAIGNKKYVNVYVPDNRVNNYKRDEYWSEFNIVVKSADAVEGEVSDVTVEPEETTAQFTWPTDNTAGSYTIEITKDGVVFCTLIFNANGQLTGIAFAPGRNGNEAPMAAMTANGGMQFTVTGLDAGTSYAYTVTTKDKQDKVVATYEGSFETSGSMEDGIMDVQSGAAPQKVLHNGQIYILRGEKMFTLQGVEVK